MAINVSVLATIGYRWKCKPGSKICERQVPCEYLCEQLSLSASQRQKMEIFKKAFDEKTDRRRKTLSHKRNDLVELLNQPSPDYQKIDSLINQIGIAQAELEKEVIDHILQEKEILTPEQQKKFLDLIKCCLLPEQKCEEIICPGEK